jgi:catechol 2,3-dioxygenase-like lactoylglutathione lyase family enzyme
MATVRYIVRDVDQALDFYCRRLGFETEMHPAPAFAIARRGDLRLLLSAPNPASGGGQPMADGTAQAPGGWNRISLETEHLDRDVADLREAGARFRNDIVNGVGGRQILLEDPSGNAVELFEPAKR